MKRELLLLLVLFISMISVAQTTEIVILSKNEIHNLRELIEKNEKARLHCDSIVVLAEKHLADNPQSIQEIFYEGLLDNHPDRIRTVKSLEDMDKVVDLIYASYCKESNVWSQKAREFVIAWVANYKPDGNPINENKLSALFWAYYIFKSDFSDEERKLTEEWMTKIAMAEMKRTSTPNNNWEAKRLKIIGTVGCITGNTEMKEYAADGFKTYIATAYYDDGTSNDLRDRDALHYHIGGLKPSVAVFITLAPFDPLFDLYNYVSPSGSSIRKSVEFTWPYASGEKQREEWTNSKVRLDKERAASGLTKYQAGSLFDPKDAIPLFEWAGYYKPEWYSIFKENVMENNYLATWTAMVNSPLIRKK
jgi:hypothetical protein